MSWIRGVGDDGDVSVIAVGIVTAVGIIIAVVVVVAVVVVIMLVDVVVVGGVGAGVWVVACTNGETNYVSYFILWDREQS